MTPRGTGGSVCSLESARQGPATWTRSAECMRSADSQYNSLHCRLRTAARPFSSVPRTAKEGLTHRPTDHGAEGGRKCSLESTRGPASRETLSVACAVCRQTVSSLQWRHRTVATAKQALLPSISSRAARDQHSPLSPIFHRLSLSSPPPPPPSPSPPPPPPPPSLSLSLVVGGRNGCVSAQDGRPPLDLLANWELWWT